MSIRRLDPAATFKLVSSSDDALQNETPAELEALPTVNGQKQTRFSKYLENFDESVLQFKTDTTPTYFIVRALLSSEQAAFDEKYVKYDPVEKKQGVASRSAMLLEYFALGCKETEESGTRAPVTANDVPYSIAIEIGSMIQILSLVGTQLKKA